MNSDNRVGAAVVSIVVVVLLGMATITAPMAAGVEQTKQASNGAQNAATTAGDGVHDRQHRRQDDTGDGTTTITILSYNDIQTAAAKTGNLPRLVERIAARRQAHDNPVFVMGAGDEISPHALSPVSQWHAPIDVLNLIQPDADTIGNHDLDYGTEAFANASQASNFPWVATNLINKTTGEPIEGAKRYAVIEKGGVRVGVLGAVFQGVDDSVAANLSAQNITAKPIVPTIQKYEQILREKKNVDVVVVLLHAGVPKSKQVANETTVDVILAGHDEIAYPPQVVNGTIISEAQARAAYLSEINITVKNGEVIASEGRLIEITESMPRNETAVRIINDYRAEANLDTIVACTKTPLNATFAANYHHETGYGNFITDAMRNATGADVAITNAGGIRSNKVYGPGNITGGDVFNTLPFGNTVLSVKLTGAELKETLESQILTLEESDTYGAEISQQVSGVRFEWVAHRGVNEKIRDVYINTAGPEEKPHWVPLRENATYEVAVNSYMAGGGSSYPIADAPVVQRTDKLLAEVVIDYMLMNGSKGHISPEREGRMQRVDVTLGMEEITLDGNRSVVVRFDAPDGFKRAVPDTFVMSAPGEKPVAAETVTYNREQNTITVRFDDDELSVLVDRGQGTTRLDLYGGYKTTAYERVYFEYSRLNVNVNATQTPPEQPAVSDSHANVNSYVPVASTVAFSLQ